MAAEPLAQGTTRTLDAPPALHRALGFWQLVATGVGIIVGAGIYVLIGAATAEAGAGVWMAFAAAAALSAVTGLSYCELASMYPRSGAEYEYTRHAFPRWVAFLVGWAMTAALVIAAATVSLGFARYLRHFVDLDQRVAAALLLMGVAVVALSGIRRSARLTVLLSLVQVGGLLLIIGVGADHIGDRNLLDTKGAAGVLGAAALVFFAFIGFDEVATLSEETRNPTRTVPAALLTSLAISAALYVAVAIVAVSVLGADALAAAERPLGDVMAHGLGGAAVGLVALIAMVSTMNTTLLALTAASRMAYSMARDAILPRSLARLGARTQAPWVAILGAMTCALGFAMAGDLGLIAGATDTAIYLTFLATNATVVVLRFRAPGIARPFRVPLSLGRVPLLPILGFASAALMMSQLARESLLIGGVVVLVGLALAALYARGRTTGADLGESEAN